MMMMCVTLTPWLGKCNTYSELINIINTYRGRHYRMLPSRTRLSQTKQKGPPTFAHYFVHVRDV